MTTTRTKSLQKSKALAQEIEAYIPGGVDSPFRSFAEVGGHMVFFERASGSRLYDVDGNIYIDYLGAWGPAVLGHAHPKVVKACQDVLAKGPVFGTSHELELEMAKRLTKLLPSMQKVRFVNSGTEAVMSAVRLARGYTKREIIVTFQGSYHGHSDSVLVSQSHTASAGIPKAVADAGIQIPFNDAPALKAYLDKNAKHTAGVLIEPVCGSMGVVPPEPGYLNAVAELCKQYNVLLIFDEVLTGLRVARGGAQSLFDVKPDITCLGKALAGGMPIGAYGARAEIMDHLQPLGDVYQAGTFSGNPVTMAGGVATLELLDDQSIYEQLESRSAQLFEGLASAAKSADLSLQLQRVGSMFCIMFADKPIRNFIDSQSIDSHSFKQFFNCLLENGVYLPPSSVDAAAISAAHTPEDIDATIEVCRKALNSNAFR